MVRPYFTKQREIKAFWPAREFRPCARGERVTFHRHLPVIFHLYGLVPVRLHKPDRNAGLHATEKPPAIQVSEQDLRTAERVH